ncbi:cytochrome P450 family protein [Actinomadura keratinilytica]|uniref:cytochrome P450 family protein n=1 Tax=Actinomadura keratinilytica TaxID=547461 RepID=UPI00361B1E6E
MLADSTISKNPDHWRLWTDGRVPADWPLISWVAPRNMFTADGVEHQRLREPVKRAFSPRRVSALRPRITAIVGDLLDEVADLAADGRPVDLKARFALPLPLRVICDLFGVPEPDRPHVQRLCDTAFDQGRAEVDHAAAFTELRQVLGELAAAKKRSPGDDLTSRLVTDPDSSLTDDELVDTLVLLVGAGHETTVNLITNALRALLAHPEQYTLLLARQLDGWWVWADLVEETLRWASPIAALPLRYTTVPTELCGVTVPAGEALLLCYGAANRDPDHFGGDADRFDLTRRPAAHLAFGHGPHFCLGAPLARLEAAIALQELLTRFDLQPAIPPEELEPLPSLVACGVTRLPVTMSPVHRAGRKASR